MPLQITRAPLASGSVETWTLNDPASRNALSEAMVDALLAACERAAADADLRGVVLRGAGGHFCAGGSLGGFAKTIGQPLAAGEADPLVPLNRCFGALLQALCARMAVATDRDLAQACRDAFPRPVGYGLWFLAGHMKSPGRLYILLPRSLTPTS